MRPFPEARVMQNQSEQMKINKILILVEMEDGAVHQVLTRKKVKDIVLNMMTNDDGVLQLSERVEPVIIESFPATGD